MCFCFLDENDSIIHCFGKQFAGAKYSLSLETQEFKSACTGKKLITNQSLIYAIFVNANTYDLLYVYPKMIILHEQIITEILL